MLTYSLYVYRCQLPPTLQKHECEWLFVYMCPAMVWWPVQGITRLLLEVSWVRFQLICDPNQESRIENGGMDVPLTSLWRVRYSDGAQTSVFLSSLNNIKVSLSAHILIQMLKRGLTSWTRQNHFEPPTRSKPKKEAGERSYTRWETRNTPTAKKKKRHQKNKRHI